MVVACEVTSILLIIYNKHYHALISVSYPGPGPLQFILGAFEQLVISWI